MDVKFFPNFALDKTESNEICYNLNSNHLTHFPCL